MNVTATSILILSSVNREASSVVPLVFAAAAAAFLVGALIVLAVRTTVLTWITVLVLLAFAGKRRRGVVKDGNKITSEVVIYAANIMIKQRGVYAFTGAMILGFTSMALLIR
ncbi:PREDICTED: uncharacterized protein LOC109207618 [Nicotiana attenuata]|uniref:Uncharacterized protein n=1 Tax=Nicotiana attenuata TaxID=49451 RepID=A0A314KSG4_NICAT|nr:PREDICTED: uncharacterized protein LOC109207618 [Nicotiana attenuata]OIT32223.1 hypothetical protein A4A49_25638 [Nicotiana attenuata]